MSRLVGVTALLVAIITLGAICYFQGDDDDNAKDAGLPFETPRNAASLLNALPDAPEVEGAFGVIGGEAWTTGGSFGWLDESSGSEGLLVASWTEYNATLEFEPESDEPWNLLISIATYEDESSATEAYLQGPDMFRSTRTIFACVESDGFAQAGIPGIWTADCRDNGGNIGAGLVQTQEFVFFVIARYGLGENFSETLSSATQSLAEGIDFDALRSEIR